jgi:hypothetical protein
MPLLRGSNCREEDVMRTACLLVLLLFAVDVPSFAQRPEDLQIRWGPYTVSADGGEKAARMWYIQRVAIGKAENGTFSTGAKCDAWALGARTGIRDDAIMAWRIETTPIRVSGTAVTFWLRWIHVSGVAQQLHQLTLDTAATARVPGGDVELTLRPGESFEVDKIPLAAGTDIQGKPCPQSASIRVQVDYYPGAEEEQRLVDAEMWLVERLPDGSEAQRSQPVNVRGLPYRPFRFYFDRLTDGTAALDIYGILTARLDSDAIALGVETRSRWTPESRNISGAQRFLNSQIDVKPGETVEIRLPLLGEEAGPFAKRALSIRIRARQLR